MIFNKAYYGGNKNPPVFDYTGASRTVQENGHFRIEFLTSGILTFTKLNILRKVDVCAVGGGGCGGRWSGDGYGGGGGGGGYVENSFGVKLEEGVDYQITIGDGGVSLPNGLEGDGKPTTILGLTANGGSRGTSNGGRGGSGGSGGGSAAQFKGAAGNGGSDGANGGKGFFDGGTGQGKSTRPFEDPSMPPLGAGGGGGAFNNGGTGGSGGEYGGGNGGSGGAGAAGTPNTGSGGGGCGRNVANSQLFANGGSGIAMVRDHR